jgi:hypothetical protein
MPVYCKRHTLRVLKIKNIKARMHGAVAADVAPVGALRMRKDLAHWTLLDGEVDGAAWVAHLGRRKV